MSEPTNSELQAEVSRLTRELGLERMGKPSEQPLIDAPLDRQIVLLNRQLAEAYIWAKAPAVKQQPQIERAE